MQEYDGRKEELLNLIQAVELSEVGFNELAAKRWESLEDTVQSAPSFSFAIQFAEPPAKAFKIVLRCQLQTEVGEVAVEPFAVYSCSEVAESIGLDDNLVTHFANEVAVMTLLPFVRQSIADVTQRVFDETLLMPVVARGQVEFKAPPPEISATSDEASEDRTAASEASEASEDTDRSS